MSAAMTVEVRLASADEVIDVRWRVLRAGLPRTEAIFPGDDNPAALHGVALVDGVVRGCGTMHLEAYESRPAWRLRGMASDVGFQGMGLGGQVLKLLEAESQRRTATGFLWCNARVRAIAFYESHGWRWVSELFDIPTAGLHRVMIKELA